MVEWKPIIVLPNLDMRAKLECPYAAIVSPIDYRVEKLCADHPILLTFLSKFTGQLGQQIRPSLLLMRIGTPNSYYSTEAIAAFRDILSLSVVLYARARRLRSNQGNSLV